MLFKKGGVTIVEEIDESVFSIIELQIKLEQDDVLSSPSSILVKLQILSTFFRIIISPSCHSGWRLVEPV